MYKTEDIRIRDPYVVLKDDTYYMYKSEDNAIWVHKSKDLKNWEEPSKTYELSEDSWGYADLWAPEVHLYKGKYYMFLSLLGKNGLRGTEISVCDTPDGPFTPITNGPATPENKSCIDGTLYVENGEPYIVYSADWPDNYDTEKEAYVGAIWAQKMSADLKEREEEPFLLFKSDEAICSKEPDLMEWEGKKVNRYGSDAPFVTKLKNGMLYLTWSPMPSGNYIVAAAVSENGSIKGVWKHLNEPLFDKNGGHAMFFNDVDGNRKMCIHCPECPPKERATFFDIAEENGKLKIID